MIMLCATLYVLYYWECCSHLPSVWLEVFSRQPKPVQTLRKIKSRQDLENAENSNCSSSTGLGPTLTTMTKLFAGWPASLTQMSAGFTTTVCRTSNLFSGQRRSRILRCLQFIDFSLSHLLTARNISVFLLGYPMSDNGFLYSSQAVLGSTASVFLDLVSRD